MILNSFLEIEENKFPIVVFGSGPAGLSLALELEKKNINCLVVEAGDEYYNEKSQSFYKINTEGTNLKKISNSNTCINYILLVYNVINIEIIIN